MYDIIIIGGGPAGYHGAMRAAKKGLNVALIEKQNIGGVCLNEGCIPSKTILNSSKIFSKSLIDKFDSEYTISKKNKIVTTLTKSIETSLVKLGVDIFKESGVIKSNDDGVVTVQLENQDINGQNLIIATGSSPIKPPITGIDKDIVKYSHDILNMKDIPKSIIVVGGGVIGIEMATYFSEIGTTVTIVEFADTIANGFDRDCIKILQSSLKKSKVKILTSTKVTEIINNGVGVEGVKGQETLIADIVLMSIGRSPNCKDIGLENSNIKAGKFIEVDEQCRTTESNIYAIGDVNGKSLLAHTAYREAEIAVDEILGEKRSIDYSSIPGVIYSHPEVASVGLSLQDAVDEGFTPIEKRLPFGSNGRFLAETDRERGLCKVIVDDISKQLLGVHLVGLYSSEIITTAAVLVQLKVTTEQLEEMIFPHPTVSEIIKETALEG